MPTIQSWARRPSAAAARRAPPRSASAWAARCRAANSASSVMAPVTSPAAPAARRRARASRSSTSWRATRSAAGSAAPRARRASQGPASSSRSGRPGGSRSELAGVAAADALDEARVGATGLGRRTASVSAGRRASAPCAVCRSLRRNRACAAAHNSCHVVSLHEAIRRRFPRVLLMRLCRLREVVAVAPGCRAGCRWRGPGRPARVDCAANRRVAPRAGNAGQRGCWGCRCASARISAGSGAGAVAAARPVVLLDRRGARRCACRACVAALSPRSLWNLGFEQLQIERPRLDVRRDADGRFCVAGLDMSRSARQRGSAADWFFRQHEFVVRGGTRALDRRDARRAAAGAGRSRCRGAQRAARHALRLDATPPADWGERFTLRGVFRQPLLSRRTRGAGSNGTASCTPTCAGSTWRELRRHAPTSAVELHAGSRRGARLGRRGRRPGDRRRR